MGYSERLLALAVMGTAPLLAAPECNLPRPTLDDNVFFQTETLDAVAQVAVTAPAPEHPSGRVYSRPIDSSTTASTGALRGPRYRGMHSNR